MDKYEFAFNEWHEKTQWVRDDFAAQLRQEAAQ